MVISSRWSIDIPNLSVQTWLFGSPSAPLPDRVAYIDASNPSNTLTFSDYRLHAKRLAAGLLTAGLQPGDRVLCFSGNSLFYPVVWMGVVMAGGIFSGVNPTYVAREVAFQLENTGARFLLVADGSLEVGLEAAGMAKMGKERVFILDDEILRKTGRERLGVKNWRALVAREEEGEKFVWIDPTDPATTTACLNYSSGTTGPPKGVEITHRNFVANAEQVILMMKLDPNYEERRQNAKWLCFLPLYHAYGQTYFVQIGAKRGLPVYIMPKFDFIQMLEVVQKHKITDLTLVPPIAVALAKHPATKKYDLSSVVFAGCGAAPLSRATSVEVENLWEPGKVNMKQGWGMTEATCSVMGWDPRHHSTSASVGELNPNCSARVVGDDGTSDVPHGERGELWVRGPNVMKGYWRNPSATAETLTSDLWLKTGDICYVDEHNRFHIVDRKKELIKVKGLQVAPAELEALLLEHDDVVDAAVVGVTIKGEESPRAYVVLKDTGVGKKASGREIQEWMKPRVSRHKLLTGGVVIVDSVPKNPSGKILRKILREQAIQEVGDAGAKTARL